MSGEHLASVYIRNEDVGLEGKWDHRLKQTAAEPKLSHFRVSGGNRGRLFFQKP